MNHTNVAIYQCQGTKDTQHFVLLALQWNTNKQELGLVNVPTRKVCGSQCVPVPHLINIH